MTVSYLPALLVVRDQKSVAFETGFAVFARALAEHLSPMARNAKNRFKLFQNAYAF
jgi:hypothetical protein